MGAFSESLSEYRNRDFPGVRRAAVFPKIESLPSAEIEAAIVDWDCYRRLSDDCADVRRHIVGALGRM